MEVLIKEVNQIIGNNVDEANGYTKADFLRQLSEYGCVSGVVNELIYYSDTCAFFERHKEAINELLSDLLNDGGLRSPAELLGDRWDKEDVLCLDTNNQNLLAWFAFESIALQDY